MKKVLIICDLFPPAFGPRMGYLAKYLKSYGWTPVIVTEKVNEETFRFMEKSFDVTYVDYYENTRFIKIKWFFIVLASILFGYKNSKIYKAAIALTKQHKFDIILSSTYRSFPSQAAVNIARETGLPLVVDIRDIVEQFPGDEFIAHSLPRIPLITPFIVSIFRRISIRERNDVLKKADEVTTVSVWHVDMLKKYNPNVSLIYNGFDPELFYPVKTKTEKFIITHTGRLLSLAMRDPELFFKAITRLSKENILSPDTCRIQWYVDSHSESLIRGESKKHSLDDYMDYMGYVSGSEIPNILNNSSVLLLLANKNGEDGPRGIMGTKTFEYLATEKPILCVRSDEDCLEALVKETNTGIAARTEDEVYNFLKYHHKQWQENGYTQNEAIYEKVNAYSRKEQASQFVAIFENILSKNNG
jgi:Glycosyltransferase